MTGYAFRIGQELEGTVIGYTGIKHMLDSEFCFVRVRLDNGEIVEASFDPTAGQLLPREGKRFSGRVAYPVVRTDKTPFPFGSNDSAMPMIADFGRAPDLPIARRLSRQVFRTLASLAR